jgi:hypothetical protein
MTYIVTAHKEHEHMSEEQLINLQGRTIVDFTRIIIATGNAQALIDWRARLMQCAAQIEQATRPTNEKPVVNSQSLTGAE